MSLILKFTSGIMWLTYAGLFILALAHFLDSHFGTATERDAWVTQSEFGSFAGLICLILVLGRIETWLWSKHLASSKVAIPNL